jgi:hypothetical protein
MRHLVLLCCLLSYVQAALAQQPNTPLPQDTAAAKKTAPVARNTPPVSRYLVDVLLQPIPLSRSLFHDKIDNEQNRADLVDGIADHKISIPFRETASALFTKALITDIDRLEIVIENMPEVGREAEVSNQQKIQSLRALWELLRQYSIDPKPDPLFYTNLLRNMRNLIIATNEHKALDYVIANPNIYTLNNSKILLDNASEARTYIYRYMGRQDPVMMVKRLEEFAKDTFAAEIITAAAKLEPKLIFNYTLSSNLLLKGAVYRTHDPFVQAIVQLTAESRSPLKALPFLSYLYTGKMTIDALDTSVTDPVWNFSNLVNLRIGNEPLTRQLYTDALEYSALKNFVRQMNELHDTTDEVRFQCIDSLRPASLYYLMVYGREEIYTSTFLGTFRRMMERMPPTKGNELLTALHYDHFRAFIRLCAGYNTLSEFLTSMDDTARTSLMTRFISGLQEGAPDELEDAVNVADALGSIKDSALYVFLDAKVKENYNRCLAQKNKKGTVIYNLLTMLMESNAATGNDAGAEAASARLKIPPINMVPYSQLDNDSGTICERVFFYGDEDGKTAYDGFIEDYRKNPKWKTDTSGTYWSTVTSAAGRHVVMYANKPLRSPLDEKAIDSLDIFLAATGINPSVLIHRGHSYHVKSTISRIDTNARIVILGSCGGYHNVAAVLEKSHDAHIISSKQTGVGAINEPIIRSINSQLQEGSDLNWIIVWKELDDIFQKRKDLYEKFTDYIPPHKNLGVIFIKAYRQMMSK